MSHTPGPWKFEVVGEAYSFLGCKRLNGGNGSTVIDLSDEWMGYPECGQDLQMTISKDDAALIAAAPEMLKALEWYGWKVRVRLLMAHCQKPLLRHLQQRVRVLQVPAWLCCVYTYTRSY